MATAKANFFKIRYEHYAAAHRIADPPRVGNRFSKKFAVPRQAAENAHINF
jgi:hypothetical protein